MKRLATACGACLCFASVAAAQSTATGTGAILRGLDKVDGQVTDIELPNGAATEIGRLNIAMAECRYPANNPAADAYAFLKIEEDGAELFAGWMIASSPALNALEHPRYDVWVLRCKIE